VLSTPGFARDSGRETTPEWLIVGIATVPADASGRFGRSHAGKRRCPRRRAYIALKPLLSEQPRQEHCAFVTALRYNRERSVARQAAIRALLKSNPAPGNVHWEVSAEVAHVIRRSSYRHDPLQSPIDSQPRRQSGDGVACPPLRAYMACPYTWPQVRAAPSDTSSRWRVPVIPV